MSRANATRLARALAALSLALLASGYVLSATSGDVIRFGADVLISAIAIVFSVVGVLIASRQPGNAIGWVFLAAALATGLAGLAGGYADYWLEGGEGGDVLGQTAAWYATLSWVPFVLVPPTFLLLLFPDGRLLSRRWRPVAWCAAGGIAGTFLTTGLRPGPLEDFPELANPYAVTSPLLDPLAVVAALLVVIGLFGSAASLMLRFHRAQGRQRQQIKWLALAGAVAAVKVPIAAGGSELWGPDVQNIAIMISVLGLPIAAGIAIVRHRLYDIDVVINRALVYGALTATLAGAYLATVLVLQLALSGVTAESDLAIAGSTLAVAALFRPARRRIQALVDRRFYRRRYDAARTLEGFGARLREQVELDALRAELCGAVEETVQPAHVSLWLREEVGR
jgi:hypothetical protein